ncbi:MAG: AsmA family protein [Elusimicrobia bacterium]|nr:AsmA family protein [Elusimicrobiota bacterium]
MKRRLGLLLKIAAALAVLAVIVIAALSVALKKYLPPDKVREIILTQSRRHLNREVRLQSVDLGILSGLVVKGISVSEKPDFKAGRFVSADSFQLRLKLAPLLHRSVVVDRFKAAGVKVQILRRKDGTFNFSDLMTPSSSSYHSREGTVPQGGATAAAALPFDLKVSEAAVEDAEITYADAALGAKATVSRLNAAAWDLSLSEPFEADVSLALSAQYGGKTCDAKLEWKGRANYADGKLAKMSVSSKKLAAEYAGVTLRAVGQGKNFSAPSLDIRAEVGLKGATAVELNLANAHLSSLKPEPLPDFKGEIDLVSKGFDTGGLQSLGVPKVKVPEAMLRLSGSFEGGDLKIESLVVRVPPMARVDGKGTLLKALSDKPRMRGDLTLSLDTPEFRLSDLPAEVQPYLKRIPAGLIVPAVKVQGRVALEGDTATISPTEIQTKFGKVTVSGTARQPLSPKRHIDASAAMSLAFPEIKTADLPVALPASVPKGLVLPAAKIEGKASLKGETLTLEGFKVATRFGQVAVTGTVDKLLALSPEPSLDVSLKVPETKLSDLPIQLSTAFPPGLTLPGVEAEGSVTVADDAARLRDFSVSVAKFGKVTVSGTVAKLSSGKPSLDVEAKLDMRIAGLTTSDIPYPIPNVGPKVPIPDMDISGKVRVSGEDAFIDGITLKAKDTSLTLSGTAKNALAGKIDPEFQLAGRVRLPAFKSADVPLPGVPKDLDVPASETELHLRVTPDAIRHSSVSFSMAGSKIAMEFFTERKVKLSLLDWSKMDWRQWYFYVKVSTVQVSLASLANISPATKEYNLSGRFHGQISKLYGQLGAMSIDKLKGYLVFQKVGLKLYGLTIADFTGEMNADEDEIRIAKFAGGKLEPMEGKVGGERFTLWLGVKDYLTMNPKVDMEGEFGYVDLAKFLEAKKQFMAKRASLQAAAATEAAKSTETASSKGKLDLKSSIVVRQLDHQNLNLNDIYLKTDLVDITPELADISGTADLYVGIPVKIPGNESKVDPCATSGGKVNNLIQFLRSEPSLRALAGPVSSVNTIAALVPGLPGINTMDFWFVDTRTTFKKGVLTISGTSPAYNKGFVCSNKTGAALQGTIDLPGQTVDLWVGGGKGGKLGATVHATGSMDDPKTNVSLGGEVCPKDHPYCVRQKAQR